MAKEINVILGAKVKEARWKINITRENLAEMINVSPRFLADVESGKIGVSIQTLKLLAVKLKTTADYLLGLDDSDSNWNPIVREIKDLDIKYYPAMLAVVEELKKLN